MNPHSQSLAEQPPLPHNHARYDANGNMTNDGINTLVYDAENHLVSATNGGASGTYTYDGNGLRVKKVSGSNNTVYIFSGSKVIAEYDNGAAVGSPSREYIYSGSALLAKIDSSGTKYYHQDHLSNRMVTDASGTKVAEMGTFPYGESWYNASSDKLVFTTYERDSESGNDYAQARYHVSGLGRFSSPDPIAGSTSDPQSFNRYSYVRNMPVFLTDPSGLCTTTWFEGGVMVTCDPIDGGGGGGGGGGGPGGCTVSLPATDEAVSGPFADDLVSEDLEPPQGCKGAGGGGGGGPIISPPSAPPLPRFPTPQPAPPPGYKECIEAALRAMVAHDEGMDNQPNQGYGTLVGGTVLTAPGEPWIEGRFYSSRHPWNMPPSALANLRSHPYITVNAGVSISTAFGRYQFTTATWNEFGSGGMTPTAQDAAMNQLMDKIGMTTDAMAGQIVQAIWDGNTRWASLPDSPFNQPTKSWSETIRAFQNALNTLPECQ